MRESELVFVEQSNGYAWAANIKSLLQETCCTVSQREEKCLSETEYATLQRRYRNLLTRGEKEMPPVPMRQQGRKGRVAKSDVHNLHERLRQHESAVLLFARRPEVPALPASTDTDVS